MKQKNILPLKNTQTTTKNLRNQEILRKKILSYNIADNVDKTRQNRLKLNPRLQRSAINFRIKHKVLSIHDKIAQKEIISTSPMIKNQCGLSEPTPILLVNKLLKKLSDEKIFIQTIKVIYQKKFNQNFQQFYDYFLRSFLQNEQKRTQATQNSLSNSTNLISSSKNQINSINCFISTAQVPVIKKIQALQDPFKGTFNINTDPFGFSYHDYFFEEFKKHMNFQRFRIKIQDAKIMYNGYQECIQIFDKTLSKIQNIQQFSCNNQSEKVSGHVQEVKGNLKAVKGKMKSMMLVFHEMRNKIELLGYQLVVG